MLNNPKITTVYDLDARKLHRDGEKAIALHKRYAKQAKASKAANDSFSRSFQGAARGAAAIDGPLGGVASRITAVNGLLISGAAAWTGMGAAIAGAGFLLNSSVQEFANVERQQLQLQALIKSTGQAAGLTADELDKFARSLAEDTLASPQGVREAVAVMLTFKSVSGEAFKDSIRLSQDLASILKTDVKSAALQLGKALEDPSNGLTMLRRSGVSFTESEKELIQSLYAAGDAAAAQVLILEKLESQVGGAGAAEGAGLLGKVDLLSQRWGEFKEALNETTGASDKVGSFLDGLTKRLENLSAVINPSEELQVKKLHQEYVALGEELQRLESKGYKKYGADATRVRNLKAEREVLREQISALQEAEKQRIIAEQKAKEEAAKKSAAVQQRLSDELAEQKTQRDAERVERELAAKKKQDDRIVSLQLKRFERLHDASLQAEEKDRELQIARYRRQLRDIDDQYRLLQQRGLLTQELEDQFRKAREDAEAGHVARMRNLYLNDLEESANDPRIEKEISFTRALANQFRIRTGLHKAYVDSTVAEENRKNQETARFYSDGLDAAAQKSKKWYKFQQGVNIYRALQDTYAAAVGAYKALASIPYVGPALGVAAAGAAIAFGKERVDQIRNQPMPSYEGGGFTGHGPRSGGVDGRGGFNAILHPNEVVTDLTKTGAAARRGITLIFNNAPPVESTSYNAERDEMLVNFAVKESERNFVTQMRKGGPMSDAITNTIGAKRVATR